MTAADLSGRVALVTGGTRGIGLGIAHALGEAGARLVISSKTPKPDAIDGLKNAGYQVDYIEADMADPEAPGALIDQALDIGRLDILVNNAGIAVGGDTESFPVEDYRRLMAINLDAVFLTCQAALGPMRRQKAGVILNIGSISAQRPRENAAPYAAAKFGVWGLTQAIALDGRPFGIACSCLHPGNVYVERRQESGLKSDDEPMMSIETISEVALTMLTLPPHFNLLEAICLPVEQAYLGRG